MPDGWLTNRYDYRVVRIWREDPEPYLTAGLNLVPLTPLTNVAEEVLPGLVQRMADRINAEPGPRAAKLWTATYLLMGLRYSDELTFDSGRDPNHARIYDLSKNPQGRARRGPDRRAQRLLLIQGEIRFGVPDDTTRSAIEEIQDLERLERMSKRILNADVHDWQGLLDEP